MVLLVKFSIHLLAMISYILIFTLLPADITIVYGLPSALSSRKGTVMDIAQTYRLRYLPSPILKANLLAVKECSLTLEQDLLFL